MADSGEVGLYIGISVQPIDQNRRFFDQFRGVSRPEVADNTHITAQYPEEVATAGLGTWEVPKLSTIASTVVQKLGDLELVNEPIKIDPEKGVLGHKSWWTVSIHERYEHQINTVREIGAKAVHDELGITIANYSTEGYHVSLVKRRHSGHDKLKVRIPPPTDWVITGFDVGVHVARPNQRSSNLQRYQNSSPQTNPGRQ